MGFSDRKHAVVAVRPEAGVDLQELARAIFPVARRYGLDRDAANVQGALALQLTGSGLDAAEQALELALSLFEIGSQNPLAVVVDLLGADTQVTASPLLREALAAAPDGYVLVTERAALQLTPERRRNLPLVPYRARNDQLFLVYPDPNEESLGTLARSGPWLPPLGRVVV